MDRQTFEAELKRDGYDIQTNTTPGVKVNPEHSHPFDVRAMVVQGALTLTRDGRARPTRRRDLHHAASGCLHSESYGPEGAVTLFGRKMYWQPSSRAQRKDLIAACHASGSPAGLRAQPRGALRPDRLAAERPHDHRQRHVQEHPGRALDRRLRARPARSLELSLFPAVRRLGPAARLRSASCAACRGSSSPISTPSGRASASPPSTASSIA